MKLNQEDLQGMAECIFNNNWFSQGELENYIKCFLYDVSEKQAATQLIESGKAEIESLRKLADLYSRLLRSQEFKDFQLKNKHLFKI